MDDFEKSIKENRLLFDEHKADRSKLWANIESKLDEPEAKPKVIKLWQKPIFRVAATIIIALGLFSLVNTINTNGGDQQNGFANQELNDIDAHYKGLVAYQVKLVDKNTQLSPKEKKQFLSFIDELDVEYEALKIELNKNLDSEIILEAIVINYKKRIELIENLLKQINSSKKIDDEEAYTL
ncbi:hypothetical protein [Thalassobellus sediminis]|uniref:hypothetical protein n=1 Tax=Thalassobellus sediminis TaxID=3367753 RepID=UPI0037A28734